MLSSAVDKSSEAFGAANSHGADGHIASDPSVMQTPSQQTHTDLHNGSPVRQWLHSLLSRFAILPQPLSVPNKRLLFEQLSVAIEMLFVPPDAHRSDPCYLDLWCVYLELHYELHREDDQEGDEARRLWKWLRAGQFGRRLDRAKLYVQFAAFEIKSGHPERAQVVLAQGLEECGSGDCWEEGGEAMLKMLQKEPERLGSRSFSEELLEGHRQRAAHVNTPSQQSQQSQIRSSIRRLGLQGPPKRVSIREDETSSGSSNANLTASTSSSSNNSNDIAPNNTLPTTTNYTVNGTLIENTNKEALTAHAAAEDSQACADKPASNTPKTLTKSIKVNGRQYRVLGVVGKGGSSRVFKVISVDGQVLALKKVSLKNLDDFTFNSYLNEIDLLQRFTSNQAAHIIRLIDSEVSRQSGHLLLLMEYGEIDLSCLLKQRQTSSDRLGFARYYFTQMIRAVQAVHDAKVVHCDLKPANFLLVQGTLKLIDFGISKAILNDTTNIVRENQVGTVNYMSPEALVETNGPSGNSAPSARLKIGRASDIWSLGCILYEMVHGAPPFAAFSTLLLRLKHIMDPAYDIPVPPSHDVYLDDLLRKCLRRSPKERPALADILSHPFLCPPERAVQVGRTQIEQLLAKFKGSQPGLGGLDVEQIAGLIYGQWSNVP